MPATSCGRRLFCAPAPEPVPRFKRSCLLSAARPATRAKGRLVRRSCFCRREPPEELFFGPTPCSFPARPVPPPVFTNSATYAAIFSLSLLRALGCGERAQQDCAPTNQGAKWRGEAWFARQKMRVVGRRSADFQSAPECRLEACGTSNLRNRAASLRPYEFVWWPDRLLVGFR